jgi:glycerol dehydrogenase-like iron-containing ADH family enzyme
MTPIARSKATKATVARNLRKAMQMSSQVSNSVSVPPVPAYTDPNVLAFVEPKLPPASTRNTPISPVIIQRVPPGEAPALPRGAQPGGTWYQAGGEPIYVPPGGAPPRADKFGATFYRALDLFYQDVFQANRSANLNGVTLRDFQQWRDLSIKGATQDLTPRQLEKLFELDRKLVGALGSNSSQNQQPVPKSGRTNGQTRDRGSLPTTNRQNPTRPSDRPTEEQLRAQLPGWTQQRADQLFPPGDFRKAFIEQINALPLHQRAQLLQDPDRVKGIARDVALDKLTETMFKGSGVEADVQKMWRENVRKWADGQSGLPSRWVTALSTNSQDPRAPDWRAHFLRPVVAERLAGGSDRLEAELLLHLQARGTHELKSLVLPASDSGRQPQQATVNIVREALVSRWVKDYAVGQVDPVKLNDTLIKHLAKFPSPGAQLTELRQLDSSPKFKAELLQTDRPDVNGQAGAGAPDLNPKKVEPVRIAPDVGEIAKKYGLSADDIRREMNAHPGMSPEQAAQAIKARVLNGPTGAGQGPAGGGGGGAGGAGPTGSAGTADGDERNPLTAVQQGERNDARIVEKWAMVAADLLAQGVDPKIALEALRKIDQVPTNFSKVRPWEVSEGSLADIVSEVAEGKTLVLYTKREAEDLQSLMQDPEKSKNLVFVEVSDKDTNKTAAVAGILGREDIGTIDRVVAVGGAGVKDLAVTVLAAGRGDPAAVRARFLGADQEAKNGLVNLGRNQLKSDIDYVSVPTILSTTAPGTPFAVAKEGNTVVIDQLPALTVVPLDKLQALPPEKLQALTASGLTDYFAGLSYAAGRAAQEGLSLKEAITRYVPEAMKVFEWFEANPGSFDRQHLLMAAYALRDYSLNSKPPVGGEHDLWDTLVSMKLTADTRATHGQVVAMGSLIQLHLQAQQSGDFDMFNRMRDLYSNMRAPVTAQGLGQVDMTKELLIKAIEHQSQQPTNRPSLIHDRFSQIKDPAARRQAIEQMLDAVFFQPR